MHLCRPSAPPLPRPTQQGGRDCQTHQFWVPLFFALLHSGENHTVSVGGPVTAEGAPTSCLQPTATSQRAAVPSRRPSAAFWHWKVPHHSGGDTTSCLFAHHSCSTTKVQPPTSQCSFLAHAARWWPNGSIGWPHLHACWDSGSGRRRRRSKTTLNRCGGIFVKTEEAPDP